MSFRDAIPGAVALALRLAFVPASQWLRDWIAVLALIWIGIVLTPAESRGRRWALALGCVWLAVIYGWSQGPLTFAGFR
jgi:hypothetical protein